MTEEVLNKQKDYNFGKLRNGFSIEYIKIPHKIPKNRLMVTDHYHDFYEVYYLLSGEASYLIEDNIMKLKQYDMVFINKYTFHRTIYNEDSCKERILCEFDDNIFSALNNAYVKDKIMALFEIKKISFPNEFNKYILDEFVNRIIPPFHMKDCSISDVKSKVIFFELILAILELQKEGNLIIDDSPLTDPQQKRVVDLISFINQNYQTDITLELLSRNFFTSKYYLCRIFKEITGITIMEYVNGKRLIEAERLLLYSSLNVLEISEKIGFNSANNFIRLFKNKYKSTPKVFRENNYIK